MHSQWDQYNGLLRENGGTFAFAQYVNKSLLASEVYNGVVRCEVEIGTYDENVAK